MESDPHPHSPSLFFFVLGDGEIWRITHDSDGPLRLRVRPTTGEPSRQLSAWTGQTLTRRLLLLRLSPWLDVTETDRPTHRWAAAGAATII